MELPASLPSFPPLRSMAGRGRTERRRRRTLLLSFFPLFPLRLSRLYRNGGEKRGGRGGGERKKEGREGYKSWLILCMRSRGGGRRGTEHGKERRKGRRRTRASFLSSRPCVLVQQSFWRHVFPAMCLSVRAVCQQGRVPSWRGGRGDKDLSGKVSHMDGDGTRATTVREQRITPSLALLPVRMVCQRSVG